MDMQKTMAGFLRGSSKWSSEIELLRSIAKSVKLEEELKWGKPCYCLKGSCVAIIQPFKSYVGLMFFKGKLLKDPKKILISNGPNSQSAARMEFTSVQELKKFTSIIKSYLREAIKIEQSGQKVKFKKKLEPLPQELKAIFKSDLKFKDAFGSLTPGRQRGYILHFSAAKHSLTCLSRIEKCRSQIIRGKGLNDR